MLAVRDLSVWLGAGHLRRQVLTGLNLNVEKGRWLCLLGPNGSGKSTLLKALAGVIRPGVAMQGQIVYDGIEFHRLSGRERARKVAWLAQAHPEEGLVEFSAYEVVMLGRLPHQGWLASPGREDHLAVEEALRLTGTWFLRERPLSLLSGGERQRVLLARLLAVQSDVLLMDEPIAHLDPPHQSDWLHLVKHLVAQGRTVVSVLHDVSLSLMADEVLLLSGGTLRYQGSAQTSAGRSAIESLFEHRLRVIATQKGDWVSVPV